MNQEIATVKEDIVKLKNDVGNNKDLLHTVNGEVGYLKKIMHGDGTYEGMMSKMNGHHRALANLEKHHETMKKKVDTLESWKWITIGGVWVITVLLQIFGSKLAFAITTLF